MSTRCNVLTNFNGEIKQFYHHHDGYPEGVGRYLLSYCDIAIASMRHEHKSLYENFKHRFFELLEQDKNFELEKFDINEGLHFDIQFLYFVKANEKGIEVSYKEIPIGELHNMKGLLSDGNGLVTISTKLEGQKND